MKLFMFLISLLILSTTSFAQQQAQRQTIEGAPEWGSVREIPENCEYSGEGLVFFVPNSSGIEVRIKRLRYTKDEHNRTLTQEWIQVVKAKVKSSSSDLIPGDINYDVFDQPRMMNPDGTPTKSYERPIIVQIKQYMIGSGSIEGGVYPEYRVVLD